MRRELHDEFTRICVPADGVVSAHIEQETFLVIRQFLTSRNDTINDDKRLSFDKAILQVRAACIAVAPRRAAGLAGLLGFREGPPPG